MIIWGVEMNLQPLPPANLKKMQEQFAQTAMLPFDFMNETKSQMKLFHPELLEEMLASKKATSIERILNYNQQYWYRLFTVMQEEYPLLAKVLDYDEFNHLVSDYLTAYPSTSFSLNHLSDKFCDFIKNSEYWGQSLLLEVVTLEYIFIRAFDALEAKQDLRLLPITEQDLQNIFDKGLGFQPSFYLWEENWNLVLSRKALLQAEDADEFVLDIISKKGFWCIYRLENQLYQEPLLRVQFLILQNLKQGLSLLEAFEKLEGVVTDEEFVVIEASVQGWFQYWVSLGWFVMPASFF